MAAAEKFKFCFRLLEEKGIEIHFNGVLSVAITAVMVNGA